MLDDDTVRNWHRAYERGGVEGLKSFDHDGSSSRLSDEQEIALGDWVDAHCPQSIRRVGAWVKRTFGRSYSRSGLIAVLHRLGFGYRKPEAMPRGLDDAKQQAFIDEYENLLNTMGADEAVVFVDAVHPTHQVRPAGCWARKDIAIAVEQTTGRDRLNIHGAIDLETGQTQILAVETVSALGFIKLLGEIEGTHTAMRLIRVFVDNASFHKAGIVKEWLAAAARGRRNAAPDPRANIRYGPTGAGPYQAGRARFTSPMRFQAHAIGASLRPSSATALGVTSRRMSGRRVRPVSVDWRKFRNPPDLHRVATGSSEARRTAQNPLAVRPLQELVRRGGCAGCRLG